VPEGDTIFRTATALQRALAGRVVTGFDTALAQLSRVHDDTPVTGRTIERCESRGKHLLIWFSGDLALRTHMRMSGSWHLYRPGETWQRPRRAMRVRIDTDAWVAVAFDVPVAEFLPGRDLPRSRALAPLGPDLLSPEFDRAEALRGLAGAGDRPIAAVLLDQRVVAGLGNIFTSEVLFLAGVHPDRPAASLTGEECGAIVETARRLLRANTAPGSSGRIVTFRSLRQLSGRASPDEGVWVYGRRGRPCRTCGTPIEGAKRGVDARGTYWCPRCQRG